MKNVRRRHNNGQESNHLESHFGSVSALLPWASNLPFHLSVLIHKMLVYLEYCEDSM